MTEVKKKVRKTKPVVETKTEDAETFETPCTTCLKAKELLERLCKIIGTEGGQAYKDAQAFLSKAV